jgi:hypothetical protein
MNKIIGLFVALILLISMPAAFADDENDVNTGVGVNVDASVTVAVNAESDDTNDDLDEDDLDDEETEVEEETEADDDEELNVEEVADDETVEEASLVAESSLGAEIRMLQLERAALKAVIAGNVILEILAENDTYADLELIQLEIEATHEQIVELDKENSTVEDYVALKNSLKELVSDFREIASPLLSSENRVEVRTEIDNSAELEELNVEIRNTIRSFNARRVEAELERLGVENAELVASIEAGEATPSEIRQALREAFKEITAERKAEIKENVRARIDQKVQVRAEVKERALDNFVERKRELLDNRIEKINDSNAPYEFRQRIAQRIEDRKDKIENASERIQNRVTQIRENRPQRIEGRIASRTAVRNNTSAEVNEQ